MRMGLGRTRSAHSPLTLGFQFLRAGAATSAWSPRPFHDNLQSRGQLIYFLQKPKQLKANPGPLPSNPTTKNSRIPTYTFAPARLGWHVGTASGLVSLPPDDPQ